MNLVDQTKEIQNFIKDNPSIDIMEGKELSAFYISLIDAIVDHNHLYYVDSAPIISDKEYDELFDYLKKIESHHPEIISSNSPTQMLVGQMSEGFQQAQHKVKLASLENSYDAQDLRDWDERIHKQLKMNNEKGTTDGDVTYIVEPKFDGISVELIYEDGLFKQAITRGDGLVGEDITVNAKTIKNIPKRLSDSTIKRLSVRGEIMMPKSVWREINKQRELEGNAPFANTRNATAGSVKLLDSAEVAKRRLVCYVYDVLYVEGVKTVKGVKSENHKLQGAESINLKKLGLSVFDWSKTVNSINDVISLCEDEKVKEMLENQDIDFDGLVIKVVSEAQRVIIGSTEHHPRRAIAYKFPAQLVATQINSVDFQVGRTGVITPVANLEPVELSGVTIKRVSLHNFDFIREKNIQLHDRVWLQRSGEVIPYIVSVISDRRGTDTKRILMPRICPSCRKKVVNEDIHYFCKNSSCPAQIKEKLIHFVSKNCMDIEGMGESTVDLFVDQGLLKNVADIYLLTDTQTKLNISKFPGFGDKKIVEMITQIGESKAQPLWRLINGLGIPNVGKKTAMDIVKAVNSEQLTVNSLKDLTVVMKNREFLDGIYGVGEKIVDEIVKFFEDKEIKKILQRLEDAGLNFDSQKYMEGVINEEDAKGSFSITGTFPVKREKIAEIMQTHGYIFHDSPTKKTDIMLIGESAGSKKSKAEKLGLKIFEGWDIVVKEFPFLKDIVAEVSEKSQTKGLF